MEVVNRLVDDLQKAERSAPCAPHHNSLHILWVCRSYCGQPATDTGVNNLTKPTFACYRSGPPICIPWVWRGLPRLLLPDP
jgi:hypothetical protein